MMLCQNLNNCLCVLVGIKQRDESWNVHGG